MARGAEARAAMVTGADLRLAEAGVPDRPRHADISRSDLSQSLRSDPRRAEEGADGALAYCSVGCAAPKATTPKSGQGHILDMVSIRERPAEVEDRAVPGHWEGDLLTGANDTHIATLIERNTRFTMLVKLPRKDTTTVVAALAKHIRKLPEELRRSLTWDQGKEMHAHKRFTVATNVQVYFCDPRSPWQRGSKREHQRPAASVLPERNQLLAHLPEPISTRLPCDSINVRERPWASKRQPINYKRCCTDRLNSQRHSGHSAELALIASVEIDPNVWSGRASQEVFVELADERSCINVSGL